MPRSLPPQFGRRLRARKRERLMMAACVLRLLDDDEQKSLRGRMLGSKNVKRTRKTIEELWRELGGYARKAFRMSIESFNVLHDLLEPALKEEFNVRPRARGATPNGDIPTKLRLSAALRFFAGAAIYDIISSHGMGRSSIYHSVYGVVNCINHERSLAFNANGADFPTHAEQREIAAGFAAMSGPGFDKVVLALDGMLVWTIQPSRSDCEYLKIGERMFHCYRKDKFGFVLMAGCDHETKFRWADVRHPAVTSDYLAWTSSSVGRELANDDSTLILPDHCIVGDNAFVENMTMATPIPGYNISKIEDAYNFYLSQLRITIERAFGILVHRWGILRRPLAMSILKVPAIITCLMRLHNFCIEHDSRHTPCPRAEDEIAIRRMAHREHGNPPAVSIGQHGEPSDLMGSGHHFRDEPNGTGRRPVAPNPTRSDNAEENTTTPTGMTPMRKMMKIVKDGDWRRPAIPSRVRRL